MCRNVGRRDYALSATAKFVIKADKILRRRPRFADTIIGGEIMKIQGFKGPYPNFQQLDRAVREKKQGKSVHMETSLDELARSLITLNPNLSNIGRNKDIRRHYGDFIF